MANNNQGKLYIVATPIGNMQDISLRAIDILSNVDLVACEDTRNTIKILNHFEINNKLISYHEHNKYDKADELINELKEGKNIALVSDAGTPIISDPGDVLVSEAIKNNIDVVPIPGATALISALIVSGLNAKRFTFLGFIPDNKKEKYELLNKYKDNTETLIMYSSKSQIKKDIEAICEVFENSDNNEHNSERQMTISRELTKIHEEIIRGSIREVNDSIKDRELLGEFVICIEGEDENKIKDRENNAWKSLTIEEHVKQVMIENNINEKDAIKKVSKIRNLDKNEVYKKIKVKGD